MVEALHVPLSEVTFWDETIGVVDAENLATGANILAEHITQRGNAGVLCYWMQHYLDDPVPPLCTCRGNLYPLVGGEAGAWWTLDMARNSLPNLDHVREIRNPWYSDAGLCAPCFYLIPAASADVPTTLTITVPAAQVDYVVAGRLLGFDFPQRLLDRERSLGTRP